MGPLLVFLRKMALNRALGLPRIQKQPCPLWGQGCFWLIQSSRAEILSTRRWWRPASKEVFKNTSTMR